jgi:putative ABC transport system permease protein
VALLLGVEKIRMGVKTGFEKTLSGTDLIVGARSGPINLLLYSVFRLGTPSNNISIETYNEFKDHKAVAWTVPISLGDSHKGYRVLGTNESYFENIKYGGGKTLEFSNGSKFQGLFEVVLGSEVAKKLGYTIGSKIVISHGTGEISFQNHDKTPFEVVGILNPTGTPIDKSVHVSLEAIEAIHLGWENGGPPMVGQEKSVDEILKTQLEPKEISAFFVGLKNKIAVFHLKREVDSYKGEALSAILPGVTLREFWSVLGAVELAFVAISFLVLVVSLVGLILGLVISLNERRREIAILRSVGASSGFVAQLFIFESTLITSIGILAGWLITHLGLLVSVVWLETQLGVSVDVFTFSMNEVIYLSIVAGSGVLAGVIPAVLAYRNSLSDGLTVRV